MNFKDTVKFYLSNPKLNDLYLEADDDENEDDVCPDCGKNPCECKKSKEKKPKDEDDEDESEDDEDESEDDENKENASVKLDYATEKPLAKNKGLRGSITPEEGGMLDYADAERQAKDKKENEYRLKGAQLMADRLNKAKKNATVKDDHTNGAKGSVNTSLKEELINDFKEWF